ncbi:hypothetical protein BJP07_06970 [Corynebacterium sp. NML130628]|nr:hypothetical protein BJP07_06970 [Corynebacterium sp. NML130628]
MFVSFLFAFCFCCSLSLTHEKLSLFHSRLGVGCFRGCFQGLGCTKFLGFRDLDLCFPRSRRLREGIWCQTRMLLHQIPAFPDGGMQFPQVANS